MSVFSLKIPKRSPYALRVILLFFVSTFGLYIFFVCIKQRTVLTKSIYTSPVFRTMEMQCDAFSSPPEEILYVHFPKPKTYSRKECQCNPVRYFAILSMQRSGSGWFETFLNSHPNISSNGEIFSVKARRSNTSTIFRTLDTVYNLDWVSSAAKNECVAAVGLKWMLNQAVMDYDREIANYFNWKGVSVIFLFRRNLLTRLVSVLANAYDRQAKLLNGTHKSHVHSKKEAEVLARYKPTINMATLISNLSRCEQLMADSLHFFNSTRHMILYYEDILNNQKTLSDVQEFLGVPMWRLESRQIKIHTRPLSERIENWNEVYNILNGTKYEKFVYDTEYIN